MTNQGVPLPHVCHLPCLSAMHTQEISSRRCAEVTFAEQALRARSASPAVMYLSGEL